MGLFSSLRRKFGAKEEEVSMELLSLQVSASRAIDEINNVYPGHAAAIARECRALVLAYPPGQEEAVRFRYNNLKAAGNPQKMAAWLAYVTMKAARIGSDAYRRGFGTGLFAIGVQKDVEDFFVANGVPKWKENITSREFIRAHRDEKIAAQAAEPSGNPAAQLPSGVSAGDVHGVVETAKAVTKVGLRVRSRILN